MLSCKIERAFLEPKNFACLWLYGWSLSKHKGWPPRIWKVYITSWFYTTLTAFTTKHCFVFWSHFVIKWHMFRFFEGIATKNIILIIFFIFWILLKNSVLYLFAQNSSFRFIEGICNFVLIFLVLLHENKLKTTKKLQMPSMKLLIQKW